VSNVLPLIVIEVMWPVAGPSVQRWPLRDPRTVLPWIRTLSISPPTVFTKMPQARSALRLKPVNMPALVIVLPISATSFVHLFEGVKLFASISRPGPQVLRIVLPITRLPLLGAKQAMPRPPTSWIELPIALQSSIGLPQKPRPIPSSPTLWITQLATVTRFDPSWTWTPSAIWSWAWTVIRPSVELRIETP
jgi:hypothetical protein